MAELCETRGQAQVDMYPESDDSGKIVSGGGLGASY